MEAVGGRDEVEAAAAAGGDEGVEEVEATGRGGGIVVVVVDSCNFSGTSSFTSNSCN